MPERSGKSELPRSRRRGGGTIGGIRQRNPAMASTGMEPRGNFGQPVKPLGAPNAASMA